MRYRAVLPLLYLLMAKEALQLLGLWILINHKRSFSGPIYAGKLSTAVLFGSLICFIIFPNLSASVIWSMILLDAIALLAAFGGYCLMFFRKTLGERRFQP